MAIGSFRTCVTLALVTPMLAAGRSGFRSLSKVFVPHTGVEGYHKPVPVPHDPAQLAGFTKQLDAQRRLTTPQSRKHAVPGPLRPGMQLGRRLSEIARQRWELATRTTFLADAADALGRVTAVDGLMLATAGTIVVFHGQPLQYPTGSLTDLLSKAVDRPVRHAGPLLTEQRRDFVATVLRHEQSAWPGKLMLSVDALLEEFTRPEGKSWHALPPDGWYGGFNALVVHLLAPDPLELLHRRVLRIPDGGTEQLR